MSKTTKILLGLVISFVAISVLCVVYGITAFISARDYAGQTEVAIKTAYDNNRNILSTYYKLMQTQVQIPEMARNDIIKVIEASMKGRYGDGGAKAVFQAIQEVNPNVDPGVYRKISQIDEAKRNEFQQGQTRFLDIRRGYEQQMALTIRGFWIKAAGFPKIDLAKYDIVTDDRTEKAFETKREEPLQLRSDVQPVVAK